MERRRKNVQLCIWGQTVWAGRSEIERVIFGSEVTGSAFSLSLRPSHLLSFREGIDVDHKYSWTSPLRLCLKDLESGLLEIVWDLLVDIERLWKWATEYICSINPSFLNSDHLSGWSGSQSWANYTRGRCYVTPTASKMATAQLPVSTRTHMLSALVNFFILPFWEKDTTLTSNCKCNIQASQYDVHSMMLRCGRAKVSFGHI